MTSIMGRLTVAFIIALCLTILPMPSLLTGIKPPWILLLILYIQFYIPHRFNLMTLIIIGLILDVLLATIIGEHAFALSFVTWAANSKSRRFCFFSMGQQMVIIGFFCFLYQFIMFAIDAFLNFHTSFNPIIISSIISMLIWPWLRLIVDEALRSKVKKYRS